MPPEAVAHHATSRELRRSAELGPARRNRVQSRRAVAISGSSLVALAQYGNLLIVDPEEEFYAAEVTKLVADVGQHGLGLIVFAEWYNVDIMAKMRFFDDNTRSWWTPITGAAVSAHCTQASQHASVQRAIFCGRIDAYHLWC